MYMQLLQSVMHGGEQDAVTAVTVHQFAIIRMLEVFTLLKGYMQTEKNSFSANTAKLSFGQLA